LMVGGEAQRALEQKLGVIELSEARRGFGAAQQESGLVGRAIHALLQPLSDR
jgi:hypothetical protein